MFDLHKIIEILRANMEPLRKEFHVKSIGVFGSYSRNEATSESDVDLIVDFDKPMGLEFISLSITLEQILKKKVDLISRNAIKPKYYEIIKNEIIYV